ncbi:odorant receptor 49a-like [Microplitis mediator]|uniref:odorant receptor 49a-like n=1 Tax=Microplitis mediator TaxID=375433 RepID=UPI002555BEF1|nr:odorant receptor 49a-like [Microplitis mediator]
MDIFDEPYYKTARKFGVMIGQWPYQKRSRSVLHVTIFWTAMWLQTIPQIIAMVKYSHDPDILIEALSPFIIDLIFIAKYINSIYHAKVMKELFDRIKLNWGLLINDKEREILLHHSKFGQWVAVRYAAFVYSACIMYILEPMIPWIISIFYKSHNPVPRKFSLPLEYIIFDQDKYYWLFLIISNVFLLLIMSVVIACDVLLVTCVHHVTGLFAVVGFRIENVPPRVEVRQNDSQNNNLSILRDVRYEHYVSCVKAHNRALKYAELLETNFSISLGAVVALNLPLMSVTGVQLITQSNKIEQTIKNVMYIVAQSVHLYFDCFLSEKLIDMSMNIQRCIAKAQWYDNSTKSQKLLMLMTMRSQKPCRLTAGKIIELTIENFGKMMKTAGSYFTVLLSTR